MDDINCVFEGVAGIGGIYISNLRAAKNINLLNNLKIKAIVTAVRGGNVKHDKSDISDHLYVPADDIESYDLSKHFEQTYHFIDNARKKTNVLVHCYAGISRSATLVIAYLLRKYNYSLDKVISMVKRRRGIINPNKGFLQQLKKEALKMGLSTNENQKPVQQVLRKNSFSVQKKRAISAYTMKRIINQSKVPIKVGRISLTSALGPQYKQRIQPQIENNQIQKYKSDKISTENPQERRNSIAQNEKQKQLQIQNEVLKIKKVDNIEKHHQVTQQMCKSAIFGQDNFKEKVEIFGNKTMTGFNQKMAKIQKLKLKVLQSQKKKQFNRRHLSQFHQGICREQQQKKTKTPTVLLSSQQILSLKLNNFGENKIQACKNVQRSTVQASKQKTWRDTINLYKPYNKNII